MLIAEPIWFSVTVKLLVGNWIVLGYFIFMNKSGYGFRLFFALLYPFEYIEPPDARVTASSKVYKKKVFATVSFCKYET